MRLKILLVIMSLLLVVWSVDYNRRQKAHPLTSSTMQDKIQQLNVIYGKIRLYTGQPNVEIQVIESDQVNAWTDGKTITFTTKILELFNGDEDEIAMVVAHETAHVMLGHVTDESDRFTTAQKEGQADKMGAYLMLMAGYDACRGEGFFTKLQNTGDGDFADPGIYGSPHPSYAYRKYSLEFPWCK